MKRSFSTESDNPEPIGIMIIRQIILMSGVVVIALILKPDLFGLIPNSLDPMFYTGYSINLDDALAAAGNGHYFVTRWASYLPQYFMCQIFGPYWGRIALRILMLATISEVFWRIGKKFKFTTTTRIVSFGLVVLMPMFVRAFTTDYQEYAITFYGILLIAVAINQKINFKTGILFGLLTGLMLVTNPFSLVMILISAVIWIIRDQGFSQLRNTLISVCCAVMTLGLVVFSGYALFRFHYHVPNIYRPTIDFIQNFKQPEIDYWTAPGRSWLDHFGWIYLSPLVVFISIAVLKRDTSVDIKRTLRGIQSITVLVFLFHVYSQFSRGHALETGYYWGMSLPPLYLLLFLLFGTLLEHRSSRHVAFVLPVVISALIYLNIPQRLQLGAGVALFVALGIIVITSLLLSRTGSYLLLPFLVVSVFWVQLGSPPYLQKTYGGDSNTPRYDLVYGEQSLISSRVLREAIWFTDEMDALKDDWRSTFLSAGGWSAAIVGTYIPHPFSRWITPVSADIPLSANVADELEFGRRKYLVIYGDSTEVARLVPGVKKQLPRSVVLIDKVDPKNLKYRLVVLNGNPAHYATSFIPMSRLDRNIGSARPDGSVLVTRATPTGFVSFGPYFGLGQGRYRAVLHFETNELGGLGKFEIYNDLKGSTFSRTLTSDHAGKQKVSVDFTVTENDATWQIRTQCNGNLEAIFSGVTLERLSKK